MDQRQKNTNLELSFRDHLAELRRRLLYCVIFLAVGMGLGWAYHEKLTKILQRPLGQQLYFTDPAGGLGFVVQISFFAGLLFAIPIIIHQLLQFIRPISQKLSSWVVLKYVLASLILASAGVAFAYFFSLPAALKFLLSINSEGVTALISADKYLAFVMTYLASFALIFQLPLILLFINRITPLSGGKLMKYERPVIILSFIAAAILTPTPDPLNQLIMALPMILLYQVAVACVLISNRVRRRPAPKVPAPAKPVPAPAAMPTQVFHPARPAVIRPTFGTDLLSQRPAVLDLSKSAMSAERQPPMPQLLPQSNLPKRSMDIRRLGYSS